MAAAKVLCIPPRGHDKDLLIVISSLHFSAERRLFCPFLSLLLLPTLCLAWALYIGDNLKNKILGGSGHVKCFFSSFLSCFFICQVAGARTLLRTLQRLKKILG